MKSENSNLILIDDNIIDLKDFQNLLNGKCFQLSPLLQEKIKQSQNLLKSYLNKQKTIYGVNTGYGYDCMNLIEEEQMIALQKNLISYLRCGTGDLLSYEESKTIGWARFISISKGLSGVSLELINRYKRVLELDLTPLIPKSGSLGASGDLIPLAYWAHFLEGEGEALHISGKKINVSDFFKKEGLNPYCFKPKEGLSIVNGTSAMAGYAYLNFKKSKNLIYISGLLTAWGVISTKGWTEAFSEVINTAAKNFLGQSLFAKLVKKIMHQESYESKRSFDVKRLAQTTERPLQDRYSIRCAPQIMGPFIDTMNIGRVWIEHEINGVSDNPIFDSKTKQVAMGGNFYGGYMAHLMDYLKISLINMADMIDRQLLLVMDGYTSNGLPTNLINPELRGFEKNVNHGLKGLHQSVSAITSEIAALSVPNSIFSRSSEIHNQDKVSLGFSACKQYAQMLDLSYELVALSAVCLSQALDIRSIKLKGESLNLYNLVRRHVSFVKMDQALTEPLNNLIYELKQTEFSGNSILDTTGDQG